MELNSNDKHNYECLKISFELHSADMQHFWAVLKVLSIIKPGHVQASARKAHWRVGWLTMVVTTKHKAWLLVSSLTYESFHNQISQNTRIKMIIPPLTTVNKAIL